MISSKRLGHLVGMGGLVLLAACVQAEAESDDGHPLADSASTLAAVSSPESGREGAEPRADVETTGGDGGEATDGERSASASGDRSGRDDGSPGVQNGDGTVSGPSLDAVDSASPSPGMGSDAVDVDEAGPMIHTRPSEEPADFPDARFPRPENVRGLYVNAWAAGSSTRMQALLDLARRTEINAFVIDIKDASGFISHETRVALAHEVGATRERRIGDLPALLDRLHAEGIYPIARIVVVKDPVLSTFRPELAVQDTAGGVWVDSKDIVWLNPYSEKVWEYHVDIAREVAEMGFPEIQWDYIRFPDAPESDMARAVFPDAAGRTRVDAIRGFLSYARESLSDLPVRSTADVFGVTTSFNRDIGLGQLWEGLIDVVDVALPMVYPSHYWEGSFGYADPNAYPYEVVRAALRDAQRRSAEVPGAGLTRPWLQDFTLGLPIYGAAEVRAQIQAVYDAGIREWILWNPSTRYTESALEPVDGFQGEPLVRVAGLLTPVSRRHVVLDSVAALPVPVDTTEERGAIGEDALPATDTAAAVAVEDTVTAGDTAPPTEEDAVLASPAEEAVPASPAEEDAVISGVAEEDTVIQEDTVTSADTVGLARRPRDCAPPSVGAGVPLRPPR